METKGRVKLDQTGKRWLYFWLWQQACVCVFLNKGSKDGILQRPQ